MNKKASDIEIRKIFDQKNKLSQEEYIQLLETALKKRSNNGSDIEKADRLPSDTKMQQRLQESEVRYKTLIEGSPVPVLAHSEYKVVYINQAAVNAFGGESVEACLGLSIWKFIEKKQHQQVKKRIQNIYEQQSDASAKQETFYKFDGTPFHVNVYGTRINFEGKPASQVVFYDVTENIKAAETLKAKNEEIATQNEEYLTLNEELQEINNRYEKANKELTESEEKFRTAFQTSPDAFNISRMEDGLSIDANDGFFKTTGYSPEEVLGKDAKAVYIWKNFDDRKEFIRLLKENGFVNNLEADFLKKDGTIINGIISASIFKMHGTPHIMAVTKDISNIKQAEKALYESEKKYRHLVERANDGIAIIQDKVVKYANKKLLEMWNGPEEEAVGKEFMEFIHSSEVQKVLDIYKRRIKGMEVPAIYETKLFRRDGSIMDVEFNAGMISYEGEVADLVLVRDITERKKVEAELEQAKKDWQNIFEAIGQPAIILDKNHKLIAANKAVEKATGKNIEELRHLRCFEIFHCTESVPCNCPMEKLMKTGKIETLEIEMEALNGTYLVSCTPVVDENNEIKRIIHIATDITDRKKAEEALSESEERLGQALKGADLGLWDWNIKKDHVTINDRWAEMLGYIKNELDISSKIWLDMIHHEDREFIEKVLNTHLKGDSEVYEVEFRMQTKKGNYKWILARGKIMEVDLNNNPTRMVGTHLDIHERKIIEQELEKNRIMLQNVLDTIPTRVFWKDTNFRYLGCNKLFASDAGLQDSKEITQKTDKDMPWKNHARLLREDDNSVLESGEAKLGYEGTLRLHDGQEIKKIANKIPLKKPSGEIYGLLGMYEDITEKKKTEKELNSIFELSSDLICISSLMGKFIKVNPAFEKTLGFTSEEILTAPMFSLMHPDDIEPSKEIMKQKLQHGATVIEMENRYRCKDGGYKWLSWVTHPIPEEDIAFAIARDITDTRRTKQILENTVANLQAMIENTDDYIMIADEKGFPLFYNSNYKKIIENTLNIKFKPGIKPHKLSDDAKLIKLWDGIHERVLGGEKFKIEFEWPLEGTTRFFEFSFFPVTENGKVIGFAEHSRDITQIKEKQRELEKAKEKAEESDRLKSAFLANMSHEIRTPMNGIIGFSELLDDPETTEQKRKRYIEIIKKRSSDLLNILNDILDISKIEAGQLEIKSEEFFLNNMLDSLHIFYKQKMVMENLEDIKFVIEPALINKPLKILSDESRIRQVLTNLIDNAFKFTEKGTIELGFVIEKNKIRFFVSDTGIGIPKHKQKAIFKRFIQDDNSTSRKHGGTGLGLAICKGLVDLMDGEMWVESEGRKGSTFYFTVEYNPVLEPKETKNEKNASVKHKWAKKTLLLIEDDETSREYFQEIMKSSGIHIVMAETAKQGLDLYRNNKIDIILLDIDLPDMNGYELTKIIRKKDDTIPIIAQTAFAMHNDRSKAIGAGCTEYLPKPIDSTVLFELLALKLGES